MALRAVALLVLAAVAGAQDELCETVWIVSEDGVLLGWPDPEHGEAMGELAFKPGLVFGATPGGILEHMCPWAKALLLVPGPADLASLCDPERHLKKTNQSLSLFDEWLLISTSDWKASLDPLRQPSGPTDPAGRRAHLDTLLGWRVLERRELAEGAAALKEIAQAEGVDPITRLAAADIAAALEGRRRTAIDLPALDRIPPDADVLLVVDQQRIPAWRDYWRLHRKAALREARGVLLRVGVAITAADFRAGQWNMDRDSEGFYELARRFGNARVHRTVLALRLPEDGRGLTGAKFLLRCDGLFEMERFKEGCAAGGVKPVALREGAVSARFGDVDVTVAPDVLLVSRGYPVPAAGGGIPADLARCLRGDDAIRIHCRKVPFADRLPVEGIGSLTVRAKLEGGVAVRVEATFRDEAAARAAKEKIGRWKPDLTPVELREADPKLIAPLGAFLESLELTMEGATLVAQASAPGETPECLFAGLVELRAFYGWEEEVEGDGK